MKLQALFSSKNKSKNKIKCRRLQFLFGALRVNSFLVMQSTDLQKKIQKIINE